MFFFEINQIFIPNLNIDFYIDNYYWTYYIFIELEKIPKKYNPDSFWLPSETTEYGIRHNYNDHTTLNNIYFYSGISFYSKVRGLEQGEKKIIKIGCDFAHEDIYSHVTKTIHSLFNKIPEYGGKS